MGEQNPRLVKGQSSNIWETEQKQGTKAETHLFQNLGTWSLRTGKAVIQGLSWPHLCLALQFASVMAAAVAGVSFVTKVVATVAVDQFK